MRKVFLETNPIPERGPPMKKKVADVNVAPVEGAARLADLPLEA